MTFRELVPGRRETIAHDPELFLTAFPVFHGDWAPGSVLSLFECADPPLKVILTGDLLCPLLRDEDLSRLEGADDIFVDANTRYPAPASSHWSIVPEDPGGTTPSPLLDRWKRPSYLLSPHARSLDAATHDYFDTFLDQLTQGKELLLWSVFDFAARVQPHRVHLLHYSGHEDRATYGKPIQTDADLLAWTRQEAARSVQPIQSVDWAVPTPGSIVDFH